MWQASCVPDPALPPALLPALPAGPPTPPLPAPAPTGALSELLPPPHLPPSAHLIFL
jgi:hypothetical protein